MAAAKDDSLQTAILIVALVAIVVVLAGLNAIATFVGSDCTGRIVRAIDGLVILGDDLSLLGGLGVVVGVGVLYLESGQKWSTSRVWSRRDFGFWILVGALGVGGIGLLLKLLGGGLAGDLELHCVSGLWNAIQVGR